MFISNGWCNDDWLGELLMTNVKGTICDKSIVSSH